MIVKLYFWKYFTLTCQLVIAALLGHVSVVGKAEVALFGSGRGALDTGYFLSYLQQLSAEQPIYSFYNAQHWLEPDQFCQYRAVIVFQLEPSAEGRAWSKEDVELVTDWVKDGGMLVLIGGSPYRLVGQSRNLQLLEPLLGATRYHDGGEAEIVEADHPLLESLRGHENLLANSFGVSGLTTATPLIRSGPAAQFSLNKVGKGFVVYLGVGFSRLSQEQKQLYAGLLYRTLSLVPLTLQQPKEGTDVWGLEPLGPLDVPTVEKQPPVRVRATKTLRQQTPEGEPLVLTNEGQPRAIVVTPNRPDPHTRAAAKLWLDSVEKMTGTRLSLYQESQVVFETDNDGHWRVLLKGEPVNAVLIGNTQLALPLVQELPPEGYVLKSLPNGLFLVAGKIRFAVIGLLERHLGFRWLWPGELGEVVPQNKDAVLPAVYETDAPALPFRRVRNSGYSLSDRIRIGLQRLGVEDAETLFSKQIPLVSQWSSMQPLGASVVLQFGHSYDGWWKRYGEQHPEWFALQPNNSRIQQPHRERLCVSNHELTKAIAADRIAKLKQNPNIKAVSISPNDGSGQNNFCMCPNCRSYDSPLAPLVNLLFNFNGYRVYKPYPSLSDRYLDFYNRIAEEVAKQYPDRWVGGYAYSAYRSAPVYKEVHPNLLIGFVGLSYFNDNKRQADLQAWNGWARTAKQIFLRPNAMLEGHGYPSVYVHKLAEDIRHCYETGMVAADFSSIVGHWAGQGLNYYILPRLLWDPSADVTEMVRDYCEKGFGKAADEIYAYFKMLEALTNQIAAPIEAQIASEEEDEDVEYVSNDRRSFLNRATEFYTAETLEKLNEQLDRAILAAGEDELVCQRIEFLRLGVTYATLQSRLYKLYINGEIDTDAGRSALTARQQFFHDVFANHFFAVGVAHVSWKEGWVTKYLQKLTSVAE